MINYVDDKGFLSFSKPSAALILQTISGRRVSILTKDGVVRGITGRRAIHLLNAEERKKKSRRSRTSGSTSEPSRRKRRSNGCASEMWVCMITLLKPFHGSLVGVARAFDNKSRLLWRSARALRRPLGGTGWLGRQGCFGGDGPRGDRLAGGARTIANRVPADFAIAVDVGGTPRITPECEQPALRGVQARGRTHHHPGSQCHAAVLRSHRRRGRTELKIPYQIEASPRPTATDGRELQMGARGSRHGRHFHPAALHAHAQRDRGPTKTWKTPCVLLAGVARSLRSGGIAAIGKRCPKIGAPPWRGRTGRTGDNNGVRASWPYAHEGARGNFLPVQSSSRRRMDPPPGRRRKRRLRNFRGPKARREVRATVLDARFRGQSTAEAGIDYGKGLDKASCAFSAGRRG